MPVKALKHERPAGPGAQGQTPSPGPSGVIPHSVLRMTETGVFRAEYPVVEEYPLTIHHNDQELVTLLCSPGEERHLVLGFLASEGVIASTAEVSQIDIDTAHGLAWVESTAERPPTGDTFLKRCLTACCGRGRAGLYFANDSRLVRRVKSRVRLSQADIKHYVLALEDLSVTFRETGGVHGGALFAAGRLVCFSQDVGRHNVLDKLYGCCLDQGIPMKDMILSFSGRVSSEILLKVSKMNVPVIIARAAPTTLALGLAEDLGITVVAFARGDRCSVYTHTERIRT